MLQVHTNEYENDRGWQEIATVIALPKLRSTIQYARIRCLALEEVIERVADFRREEDPSPYIARLFELKLAGSQLQLLVAAMERLALKSEKAKSKTKIRIDRALLRLVRALPSELAIRFAEPYVDHRRKGRRQLAYVALRQKRLSPEVARKCADSFHRTGDQEALELVARNPECIPEVGAEFLLTNLNEKYWRARVLEAMIVRDRASALFWSRKYPFEFAHAVGRIGDPSLAGTLRSLFESNSHDPEFLSIYAYALGKIGAAADLDVLDKFVHTKWAGSPE